MEMLVERESCRFFLSNCIIKLPEMVFVIFCIIIIRKKKNLAIIYNFNKSIKRNVHLKSSKVKNNISYIIY